MSKLVKLKKGFDIKLVGKAEKKIVDFLPVQTFAIKPTDFIGMQRPKVVVNEGDIVKAGAPLLFDKAMDQVLYVSPVSGEIVEIKRGEKRKLLEIKILADKEISFESFQKYSEQELKSLSKQDALAQLTKGGVWPQFIQRPFGIVANPSDSPKAIFVSGFDTHPLAPDLSFTLKGMERFFQAGIDVLKKLTTGIVHLNVNADSEGSSVFSKIQGAQINSFSGPHPAGNVGVQIHHLNPVSKGEIAWTISPFGVVQVGKLFLEGIYDASKIIAITGSEAKITAYTKTYLGACVDKFVAGNLVKEHTRVISGNVLTGEKINKDGYLGYYHNQITLIPEGDYYEFLGWMKPTASKLSYHRALGLLSFLTPNKEFVLDSNVRGEERAFVQTGVFESVTPMDILPVYLLKAILAEDYDEMEELGIYELVEEDLALCEFVDVSKHPVQEILRKGIDLIQYS
ncbi:Na(+)-translocating NADH-quinone reductase subunit A [Rhodonellum psychrophilum GCM71 = DSM 17998]|uniref:Na(+)-translocating NADH-quinone reductase subunit A n=2 Tax=Rhodonellum TaxID=336827 RepID=U5C4F2_9BACT|nr:MULTISPECIES: Na(+)-translocating NADH-quinone reductase subunit A [Rhodonellum]ERM84898.1 Na(+)-translocating NADH-quinone reductase subunit A [Rhodonellum psychrophilum GCM71 = DSM 17998]MDO9552027.1 Na(+)-translocating NADH-quinone reductase subunit A [Rhodonellum sp.]SDY73116.1 Na+-transporting NADH:ubiquinone oxidoreductase subunit A [Rhodonellum ikkaensis]